MKHTERIVIYAALILLGAMNAVFLLSHSGRAAFAETASMIADVLGPADGVKLVEDGKEITVHNHNGRVAWGDGDFRQTYTIGFVDIGRALNPLMESSQFVEERDALRAEFDAKEKEFQSQLEALAEQLRGMDRESPEAQQRIEEYRRLYTEYTKWGQEVAIPRRDELDVKHMQKAYKELTSAVNVVADKLGVDIVLRFIPTDNEFKAVNGDQALSEVRLRSAVKYPEKLDITSEVLEELSLQDKDR